MRVGKGKMMDIINKQIMLYSIVDSSKCNDQKKSKIGYRGVGVLG